MNEKTVAAIIQWLYLNDGYFDSKSEWRVEFVRFLYQLADQSDLDVKQGND